MKKRLSPRVSLLIIAALFLLPLLLAWFMYSGVIEFRPGSRSNLGELIDPPVPLGWEETVLLGHPGEPADGTARTLGNHWVVLRAVPDPCNEFCRREVTALRQIHLASGRHRHRVRIALLVPDGDAPEPAKTLRGIYSRFDLLGDPSGSLGAALEQAREGKWGTYLIDPLGNIMMFYEAGADPNHLKKDLKRLLTWSKLDEQ